MTPPTLRQRLQGLAATLALLVLLAGVPFLLIAIGAAPWHTDLDELRALLLSPDDGTLAMTVIAAVAWIAWAFVAVSVILETIAQVRGLPAPSLPVLGGPQRSLGRLVAVAALLFIATPTMVAAFPAAPAHAAAAPLHSAPPPAAAPAAAPVPTRAPPAQTTAATATEGGSTFDYTVKRGDSLWKIADRLLGDGTRFLEIVDLNTTVLGGRPDFITPGTILKVPHEPTAADTAEVGEAHVVEPGDTLSEIAETTLGDPMRYPELFDASRNTVQPDGARLTDPDLIRPGWQITIPALPDLDDEATRVDAAPDPSAPAPKPPAQTPTPEEPPAESTPLPTPATTQLTAAPSAEPEPQTSAATPTAVEASDEDEEVSSAPGWLLPGLSGAGAVLAAVVLLTLRAYRNTQLRYRRPGQILEHPPEELRAVEKTVLVSGGPLTATIKQLHQALMNLAGECEEAGQELPAVVTATLATERVTLHLASDADLPEPWAGAGCDWTLRLDGAVPDDHDLIGPYPMLVTVGVDDAGVHLVNLEHLGVVALRGDPERSTALARHIAAEVALSPWSTLVDVNVIGFGQELAQLDVWRLKHHPDGVEIVPSLVRDVAASVEIGWGEPEPYRLILTTGEGTAELAPLLAPPARPWVGAALVSLEQRPSSTVIKVDHTGRLRAPALGLDLHATGLSSEEATACAAIVDLTRESEPVKIPAFEQPEQGWRALADHAGALREELTQPRPSGPVGAGSLLPESSEAYTAVAATTTDDVETLAPVVAEEVARTVQEADPTLDQDLADWFNPTGPRPRLTLLGPVNAKAHGELKAVITKRKPYFVEILAYLALHPKGVTATQIADAFAIASSRARTDISSLRNWLGTNPQTGQPFLPAADESPAFRETGVKAYQVQDVLVDSDLFTRLRARGQARGDEGIDDLKAAMSLVQGEPFSQLREKGWSWLLDTERIHETTGCAIVDVAHILVTAALAKGDLDLARQVAETACQAAPYDEICRLDLIKVTDAEGHHEAADTMLDSDIFNRTDDHLPPVELPDRSDEILGKQEWVDARRQRRERRTR